MTCSACGHPITDQERPDAVVWLDPGGEACVAHGACLDVYDEVLAAFELGEV